MFPDFHLAKRANQIGANLYISETSMKSHLRSSFTRMNVRSRTQSITAADRRGLVQSFTRPKQDIAYLSAKSLPKFTLNCCSRYCRVLCCRERDATAVRATHNPAPLRNWAFPEASF